MTLHEDLTPVHSLIVKLEFREQCVGRKFQLSQSFNILSVSRDLFGGFQRPRESIGHRPSNLPNCSQGLLPCKGKTFESPPENQGPYRISRL